MNTFEKIIFGAFRTVFASCLTAFCNACRIKSATDNVITHTRQILDSAASDKNNAVLLQIVTFAGDINSSFHTVDQTHSCDFTKSGVRLLGGSGRNAQANAAFLRALIHDRRQRLLDLFFSAFSDKLIDGWHYSSSCKIFRMYLQPNRCNQDSMPLLR